MARFPSFPTLFDEVRKIDITVLTKAGCLKTGVLTHRTYYWVSQQDGTRTASISYTINTIREDAFIELDYTYNKEQKINYRVGLISAPSNLGKGLVWYFVCPVTHKRCRKLYLVDGYFLHREAFKGCMYESQTYSKRYRELDKTMGAYLRREWYYPELYKKHSKKTYAGKPTKRYVRLMKLIEKGDL